MDTHAYEQKENQSGYRSPDLANLSAGNRSALSLQDNRSKAVAQKKQLDAVAGKSLNKSSVPGYKENAGQLFSLTKNHNAVISAQNMRDPVQMVSRTDVKRAQDGAYAGAAIGAAIGSFIPVVGPMMGAGVGGLLGMAGGFFGGRRRDAQAAEQTRARITAQQRFQGSANEPWREYVDKKHHGYGRHVYDTGIYHTPRVAAYTEPGYLASITSARNRVHQTLGQKLNVDEYEQIHSLAFAHNPGALVNGGWRNETHDLSTGVARNTVTPVGVRRNDLTLDLQQPTVRLNSRSRAGRQEILALRFHDKSDVSFVPRQTAEVKKIIKGIIDRYYRLIGGTRTRAEKMLLIANTHQLLERVHVFRDGNTRTNLLILNKLLTEQGYHPVILDDPNTSYLVTAPEWAAELELGLAQWERRNP